MKYYIIKFRFKLGLLLLFAVLMVNAGLLFISVHDDSYLTLPLGRYWFDHAPSFLNMSQSLVQRYISANLWDWFQEVVLVRTTATALLWSMVIGNGVGVLLVVWGLKRG